MNIKASDLRIGNILKTAKGTTCIVITIGDGFVSVSVPDANLSNCPMPYNSVEGIPLSSDILEKCGFKSEVGYYSGDVGPYQLNFYHTGNNWYLGEIGKALWERENGINFSEKQIQYLHTLQNLLHSLGEILTVSL